MADKMNTTKAKAIIARFTTDPKLTAEILGHIQDFKAGKTSLHEIIANYTSDPELTAKIKAHVAQVRAGKHVNLVTAAGADDSNHANSAAETANMHRGAIEQIVKS